jgi:hypothetical protein
MAVNSDSHMTPNIQAPLPALVPALVDRVSMSNGFAN